MINLKFFRQLLFSLIILGTYQGCTDDTEMSPDPEIAFAKAREYYDDGSYDLAVKKLGEFKSRFPYSKYSLLAELFIANSHFELGNYEQAATAYKQFVKLHPKHEKVPFAMYRTGESYWIDAPEAINRDQELTQTSINEWKQLIERFPNSEYTKQAKEKSSQGRRRIAESHEFVVEFYCKQEIYHACAYRAIKLLDDYPEYKDIRKNVLRLGSEALFQVAKQKHEDPESDKNIFVKRMTEQQLIEKAQQFSKLEKEINLKQESH